MRYQGRITDWKDGRGFGFITPNGGGDKVFLHISAFGKRQGRPAGNELLTYELVKDAKKGSRAVNVLFVGAREAPARREGHRFLQPITSVLLVAGIGYFGWQDFTARTRRVDPPSASGSATQLSRPVQFQCQGKVHCTEMTSCEEAMFYL